jgi:hypothetical protein
MKKLLFGTIIISVAVLGLSSAQNAMVKHDLKVNLRMGNAPLELGKTYKTSGGIEYSVDLLKFYVSNVQLVKADGSSQAVPGLSLTSFEASANTANTTASKLLEGGQMFAAKTTTGETIFSISAPAAEYKGIRFEIGVPKDLNHRDASTVPMPLGLESGMFWAWNPGYIFFRLEGKTTIAGKSQPWLLHMGTDNWRLNVNQFDLVANKIKIAVNGKNSSTINLDLEKVFAKGPNGAANWDLSQPSLRVMHGGPNIGQAYLNLLGAWNIAQ